MEAEASRQVRSDAVYEANLRSLTCVDTASRRLVPRRALFGTRCHDKTRKPEARGGLSLIAAYNDAPDFGDRTVRLPVSDTATNPPPSAQRLAAAHGQSVRVPTAPDVGQLSARPLALLMRSLGAKLGANRGRHAATPSLVQPPSLQVSALAGHAWPH